MTDGYKRLSGDLQAAAREHACDASEEAFNAKLKKLVEHTPEEKHQEKAK